MPRIHGNTTISFFHSEDIIDPIPCHPNLMAIRLQALYENLFLFWTNSPKDCVDSCCLYYLLTRPELTRIYDLIRIWNACFLSYGSNCHRMIP